jgi:hypothetical protein
LCIFPSIIFFTPCCLLSLFLFIYLLYLHCRVICFTKSRVVDPDSMTLRIRFRNPDPWARKMKEKNAHFLNFFNIFIASNFPLWIRIRIGSGLKHFVDPDPGWGKILDPDPDPDWINPDPQARNYNILRTKRIEHTTLFHFSIEILGLSLLQIRDLDPYPAPS